MFNKKCDMTLFDSSSVWCWLSSVLWIVSIMPFTELSIASLLGLGLLRSLYSNLFDAVAGVGNDEYDRECDSECIAPLGEE